MTFASGDGALLKVVVFTTLICLNHYFHRILSSVDIDRMNDWFKSEF